MASGRRLKDYTPWIAVGVLVIMGLWLWFDLGRPTHEPGQNPKVSELVGIPEADVTRLQIQSPGGDIVIVRAGPGWNIEQPLKAPADSDAVKQLLDGLLDHTTDFVMPNPGKDLARFQLQQTATHVTVTSKSGARRTFDIGGQDPSKSNVYVLDTQGRQIFLIASSDADSLRTKTAGDLRDKSLLSVPDTQMAGIRIEGKRVDIGLNRTNDQWQLIWSPSAAANVQRKDPADSSSVDSMTSTLSSLKADHFVMNASPDLAAYGLKPPRLTVTVSEKGGKQDVLSLGKKEEGKTTIFATVSTHPGEVVAVSDSVFSTFVKSPKDLRSRKLVDFQADDATKVSLIAPAGSWEVEKSGADWKLVKPTSGPKPDTQKVSDFLFDMTGQATKVAAMNPPNLSTYGLDKPQFTATATLKSGATKSLYLGKQTPRGDYYARGTDAMDAVFEVPASTYNALNKKADAFKP